MKSLLRIIIILVLGLTLAQCNTPFMTIIFPGLAHDMRKKTNIKLSLNKDLSNNSPILMNGYYKSDDRFKYRYKFNPDGTGASFEDFNDSIYISNWFMYEFKGDLIIRNRYIRILEHLYRVVSDSIFHISSDSTIWIYTTYTDSISGLPFQEKIIFKFVPTDSTLSGTFPLRKHRWMWEDGVMPQDTL